MPALYNLGADGDLPTAYNVVGFARREKSDEVFRKELEEAARKFSRQSLNDELWASFAQSIFYHQSEFGNLEGYQSLAKRLDELDATRGTKGNRLFYLSVAPSEFPIILQKLAEVGLNKAKDGSWSRVIVEKPFGKDLKSAQALNKVVNEVFREKETYRIDHYLGKETAQNIMVLRFANAIFEPLWNHKYIDHIQITGAEPLGVEGRGPYYESAGALRDMVQNHLLQLLSLVAMEPPVELSADAIRDEKVKVIKSLRPMSPEDIAANVVRGQYTAGAIGGKDVNAYRAEERVNPQSCTETYVALKPTWIIGGGQACRFTCALASASQKGERRSPYNSRMCHLCSLAVKRKSDRTCSSFASNLTKGYRSASRPSGRVRLSISSR